MDINDLLGEKKEKIDNESPIIEVAKAKLTSNNIAEATKTKLIIFLGNVGMILSVICSVVYIILVIYLLIGVQADQNNSISSWLFVGLNAIMTSLIAYSLTLQGVIWAKNENKELLDKYYSSKTTDKIARNMTSFWVKWFFSTALLRAASVVIIGYGFIYIVLEGLNSPIYILLAISNILMSAGMGLLSLNKGYNYVYNSFIPYVKEKLNIQ